MWLGKRDSIDRAGSVKVAQCGELLNIMKRSGEMQLTYSESSEI